MSKEEFLEKSLNANKEEVGQSKLSDMLDKNSTFYQGLNVPKINIPPSEPKVDQPVENKNDIPRIRTFNADISDAVQNDNLSTSRIALAETKRNAEMVDVKPKPKKSLASIIFIILGTMLIAGGLGVVGYVLYIKFKPKETNLSPLPPKELTMIRFDESKEIDIKNLNSRTISEAISKELRNPPRQDAVRRIKFISTENEEVANVDLFKFLEIFETRTPEELARTLQREFYVGINFKNGSGYPFLIIKGEAYESLFPGLLAWEKTLKSDLTPIFENKTASSTTNQFIDLVITNQDSRGIVDENGKPQFFYTIIDDTIAIFAIDTSSLNEVQKRLREKRLTNQ